MSQRSKFLLPISSAFTKSILRNAQSPSLQRKLLRLRSTVPEYSDQHGVAQNREACDRDASPVIREISQTIQSNLWRMMQISLYDPLAARRLKITPTADDKSIIENVNDNEDMIKTFENRKRPEEISDQRSFFGQDLDDLMFDEEQEGFEEEFTFLSDENSFEESERKGGVEEEFDFLAGDNAREEQRTPQELPKEKQPMQSIDDVEFLAIFETERKHVGSGTVRESEFPDIFEREMTNTEMSSSLIDSEFPGLFEPKSMSLGIHRNEDGSRPSMESTPGCPLQQLATMETRDVRMEFDDESMLF
jgi:hypothetical protein